MVLFNMKKIYWILGITLSSLLISGSIAFAANPPLFPWQGGTGTSTPPTYGKVLVGNSGGTYTLTATSSLGISSPPGGADTQIQFNNAGSFGGFGSWDGSTLTLPGSFLNIAGIVQLVNGQPLMTGGGAIDLQGGNLTANDVSASTINGSPIISNAVIDINSDSNASQTLSTGSSGTDFTINESGTGDHIFNIPTASGSARGLLSTTDWSTFNGKESTLIFSTGLTRSVNTVTNNLSTGISGGQTATGGTASGNNLTLTSTSNATKGKIIFGSASAYDQVNDRFGIGNTAPTEKLDVTGNIKNSGSIVGGGGKFNYDGNVALSIGQTTPFYMTGDYGGGGDLPAGGYIAGLVSGFSMFPDANSGSAGKKIVIAYNDGTGYKSAVEVANIASTNGGKLLALKGGGFMSVGSSTPYSRLSVWGGGIGTGILFELTNSASTTLRRILDNGNEFVKVGSNQSFGTTTLSSGAATVNNNLVKADSLIFITDCNSTGLTNIGSPYISAISAGTSFTISSTNILDASLICWEIKQPIY